MTHNFKFPPSSQIHCIIPGTTNHNQATKHTRKWQIAAHEQFDDAPSLGRDEEHREETDIPGEHVTLSLLSLEGPPWRKHEMTIPL